MLAYEYVLDGVAVGRLVINAPLPLNEPLVRVTVPSTVTLPEKVTPNPAATVKPCGKDTPTPAVFE